MHRSLKTPGFALVCMALVSLCAHAQGGQAIYKHIDENGRVTYSNSPIKGAERVNLQPITVLPPAPIPSGNIAVARVAPAPRAAKAVAVSAMNLAPAPKAEDIATATKEAGEVPTMAAPGSASAITTAPAATNEATGTLNRTRQDDPQRRNLLATLLAEQESLANTKARLAEESKNSESIRALRASFTAGPDKSGVNKVITPEMREQVEHHFERIRNLQDEIAMHEQNVSSLRTQLRSEPAVGVVAAQ